jgi:secondary thiamine-phosphate synthase enzyme
MRVHHAEISIRTGGPVRAHDVTASVREAVRNAAVREGLVVVSVPPTTCAVCVNENESGLRSDLERMGRQILDPLAREGGFAHDRIDDNARAHLTAILMGHQTTLTVHESDVVLGTWQSIFLLELDGPRTRSLQIQILGE